MSGEIRKDWNDATVKLIYKEGDKNPKYYKGNRLPYTCY
jgi:hypothetical protein